MSIPVRPWAAALAAAATLLLTPAAFAQEDPGPEDPLPARPVPWHHAFGLAGSGGVVNPGVLVGFNPQPEPPARITELSFLFPPDPILLLRDQANPEGGLLLFDLFLALGAPHVVMSFTPPEMAHPFEPGVSTVHTRAASGGGDVVFDVFFDIWSSSGGLVEPGSLVGFNPQPEPPGAFSGRIGMSFGIDSLSDAMVRLRIVDGQGNPIRLAAVPEPAALGLLAAGLLALHGQARRRRR